MTFKGFFSVILFSILVYSGVSASTVNTDSLMAVREDSLKELRRLTLNSPEQFIRFNANEKLIDYWMETLKVKGSVSYNFPAVDSMYIVTSPDRKLRIVTWHLLNEDYSYDFFAVVQAYSRRHDEYVVYELQDKTESLPHPEYEMLRNGDWVGAIYFDIIQVKREKGLIDKVLGNGRTFYTLLAWNGHDFKTDIKMIDVAYLQSNGQLVLGYPLFRTRDHRLRRIIFEYSDRFPMSMKYEQQFIIEEDKGKARRISQREMQKRRQPFPHQRQNQDFEAQKAEKKKKDKGPELKPEKMIIFQRLIPLRPELEGIPSQTVPHPEDYAAFIFEDGRWTYYENIDALNKPSEYDNYQRTYDENNVFE